ETRRIGDRRSAVPSRVGGSVKMRPGSALTDFFCCVRSVAPISLPRLFNELRDHLNAELSKKALEKVGNPNILVNLISRRVRQLNSGSGALSRPFVSETGNLGAADIALLEIIEDKVGFEMPEITELVRPSNKKRKKH